jgi:hypothetical protein
MQIKDLIESFQKLEFKRHIALLLGALMCVAFVGYWLHAKQRTGLTNAKAELQAVQNEVKNKNSPVTSSGLNKIDDLNLKKNFKELLSSNSKSDEVVREMSRLAAAKGIGLTSLKIAPTAATVSELGKVQYNVTMKTDYYLFKGWLSGLLGRYPALGVNTMSIRGVPTDNTKQDINLSLLLYVKD